MGPHRAEVLKKELGIATHFDLLHHYPFRYIDRTKVTPIAHLRPDADFVQIAGTLINISDEGEGRKRRIVATLYDDSAKIELIWFGTPWIINSLKAQQRYLVFGRINSFNGALSIINPDMDLITESLAVGGLQPVYPSTEKLKAKGINNRSFAKITESVFEKLQPHHLPEFLPDAMLAQFGLCPRYQSLKWIHFPDTETHLQQASYRLKWEELFLSQLRIAQLRLQHTIQEGFYFQKVGDFFQDFYEKHLPFSLTGAQKKVLREIRKDTATGTQMNRLLQGDVGSGKTIVAVMCMLLAMDNGFQACLMAPTEILSRQHFQSIQEALKDMNVNVALLTGTIKGAERKTILNGLASGFFQIVIGTHALIEEKVVFKNLGLAIIDEQHRFGVNQRAQLWAKNKLPPHILVMTATPIPRTLAMTLYGDLSVSIIDELPPGRQPIKTLHRKDNHRPQIMDFIRGETDKGRQAYIVYPLIEESEKLDFESLKEGYEQVRVFFPEHKYNVAMVHGRQDAEERKRNMHRFVKGEAHILVATTVIEVGVNVPNASVMLIESAERFGLSQLHQLRGRVGRGSDQSYCILLTGSGISEESFKRMQVMTSTTDGFKIAEEDLKMRGPGDLYGTKQSGVLKFKIADIVADAHILEDTRGAAQMLIADDPQLMRPEHAALRNYFAAESGNEWSKIS